MASTPIRFDELEVRLHDDTTVTVKADATIAGYYVHRHGLDVVDVDGQYVSRFGTHELLTYISTSAAATAAA